MYLFYWFMWEFVFLHRPGSGLGRPVPVPVPGRVSVKFDRKLCFSPDF